MILGTPEVTRAGGAVVIKIPIPEKGIYQGIRVNPGGNHPGVVSPCVVTWVSKLEEETELVGVLLTTFSTMREAFDATATQRIYTYKALTSLKLAPGEEVICPHGRIGGVAEYGTVIGTVVTLNAADAGFYLRTITERA